MEEVVLSVKLLIVITQATAPLAKLLDCLLHLVTLICTQGLVALHWAALITLCVSETALEFEQLVLKFVIFSISFSDLCFLSGELALEPLNLLKRFLLCKRSLLKLLFHVLLLEAVFLVHGHLIKLHSQLHDELVLRHNLMLSFLKLHVPITELCFEVLQFHLDLVVHGLDLVVLGLMLLSQLGHVRLEVLYQFLLVP